MKSIISGWRETERLDFSLYKEKSILEMKLKLLLRDTADVFAGLGHGRMGSLVWIQHQLFPAEILTATGAGELPVFVAC